MVGAGLFGFMINPPIALYYMQGLNTTPVHGHAALFGVYGMLGIGLMLFCLRALRPGAEWKDGLLKFAFWSINGGLMAMVHAEPAAGGPDADLGLGRARLLVRPQRRVHADRRHETSAGCASPATRSSPRRAGAGRVRLGLRTGGTTRNERFRVPEGLPVTSR